MLVAEDLEKTFGGLSAVDDVSLSLDRHEDEKVFLVGPNGAGKTTLINLLTGLLPPDEGTISLDGQDITHMDAPKRIHSGLVRSFQVVALFDSMTARQNIRVAVQAREGKSKRPFVRHDSIDEIEDAVDDMLTTFGLEDVKDTKAVNLPHGTRKLLDIAVSFSLEPKYILLDEPTSGVSMREKDALIDTILEIYEERDVGLLAIEHDMELVQRHADRVIAMDQGEIFADGDPSMLEDDEELRRTLLGK